MLQYGTVLGDVFGPFMSTIYVGKPVGQRFEQMVRKIQNWLSSSWNRVYHLYESVQFAEKRPPRPETGIKDGFSFGIFRPEQTGPSFQMFRCSRKFIRWKDSKRRVPFSFQPDFPEPFCKLQLSPVSLLTIVFLITYVVLPSSNTAVVRLCAHCTWCFCE